LTPPGAPAETIQLDVAPDAVHRHALDLRRVLSAHGTGVVWAAATAAGMLAGVASNPPGQPRQHALSQGTHLGVSVKDSAQSTLVFVTHLDSGTPVPNARVAIVDRDNRTRWRGVTDADGVSLAPPLALRSSPDGNPRQFIVTAQEDDDIAFVGSQ